MGQKPFGHHWIRGGYAVRHWSWYSHWMGHGHGHGHRPVYSYSVGTGHVLQHGPVHGHCKQAKRVNRGSSGVRPPMTYHQQVGQQAQRWVGERARRLAGRLERARPLLREHPQACQLGRRREWLLVPPGFW